ncbi:MULTISPECIES: alkaline phosphatase D family protein [Actinomadura]|uniref:Alkaline phosphatase D family protein n=1 Tax=Actinomadura yumaensis TaxID=111807 RepID=A0ABW2CW76_9ACTN|nr:alkaline phosphatase D family protein [Actinomadura sp. J1-007]MWK39563.1 hypothetical protein [Actinomadura sp. J1-007]
MAAPVAHTAAGDVTTGTVPNLGTVTVAKPANTSSGDVLVAVLNSSVSGGTWDVVPAGWTQQAMFAVQRNTAVFTKPIPSAAAETATDYTWHTTGGAGRTGAIVFRCTGVDGAQPVDAVGAGVGSGTTSIVDPAVTAVSGEALLLAVFSSYLNTGTANTITPPPGMSSVGGYTINSGTATTVHLVCAQALSAAGSTGTRTASVAPAGTGAAGIMLTLNPGSVPGPPEPPVAHTTADDTAAASVTSSAVLRVPRPAATANGDLLVAVLAHRNSGPAFTTIPPGWAPAPVAYTANGVLAAYWRHVTDAAGEPPVYTWRSPNGAARAAATVFRVTGAAPPTADGGPIDAAGAATGAGTTAIVDPAATLTAPATLLLACHMTTATSTATPVVSPPAAMTQIAAVPVVTGSASLHLQVSGQGVTASGSSGTRTAAVSPAAGSVAGFLLAIAPPGYGTAQPPQLRARLAGGVTTDQARVTAATQFTSAVRFARSTSPAMTSPTYTAATAPDRDGLAAAVFTGLTPGTRYWWAVELDGTLETGHLGTFRTLPAPGEPTSFSFAAASCADTNSNADSFADAAARTGPTGEPALFTVHLGDMHYQDIGTDDPAWALAAWLNALGQPNQAALYAAAPLAYTWSDHDFGGSNVAADSPAAAAVQAVYRRLVPSHPLPGDGAGIYQSWQVGRVLFVMTDGRSYASPITAPDTATKTKLGAAQKAWLKDQFAAPGVGLVIWCHEDAWHNASTFTGDDTWSAYATERAELAAYIQANDVPLLYVHGDVHALSHDDGSHVPGRFPLISVSPWDQTTFIGNGALTSGFYPDPVSTTVKSQQYGWFDVLDNGTQIVVRALGIADGQVVLRTEMSWGITRHLGWGIPL